MAGRVDELFAIRRNHWAHGAALRIGHLHRVAGLAVMAMNLPEREARVVGERAGALRVVDEPSVWRDDRTHAVRRRRWWWPWGRISGGLRWRRRANAHTRAA